MYLCSYKHRWRTQGARWGHGPPEFQMVLFGPPRILNFVGHFSPKQFLSCSHIMWLIHFLQDDLCEQGPPYQILLPPPLRNTQLAIYLRYIHTLADLSHFGSDTSYSFHSLTLKYANVTVKPVCSLDFYTKTQHSRRSEFFPPDCQVHHHFKPQAPFQNCA